MVHIVFLTSLDWDLKVHPSWQAQIASLKADQTSFSMFSSNYTNFVEVLSQDLVAKLPEDTYINNYAIDLIEYQPSSYELIYSLESVEWETFKIYIEINLTNGFIKLSKFSACALILFIRKLNNNL